MRIVFMGTPEFAVPGLIALIKEGHQIAAVVTSPDKPAGRGLNVQQSPIKKVAFDHGLNILQPVNLKSVEFIEELKRLNAELFVIIAFRMLPESVWTLPPKGSINLHASLLPQYRGAAPINWAIINGESETGLTTFFLKHEIDTGNIIHSEKIPISFEHSAGQLHDILMHKGADLIVKTVRSIAEGNFKTTPQTILNEIVKKTAPKLNPSVCRIDWNKNSVDIYNLIRGLSPYPAATTELIQNGNQRISIKIFKTSGNFRNKTGPEGSLLITKNELFVNCADNSIQILELQMQGKKRLATADFLRGFKISNLHKFE